MRHELKYIITPVQYYLLKCRLQYFLKRDENAGENGEYFIRSIYFDSGQYRALQEKNMGVDSRQKYRLRFYNGDATKCSLECKQKKGTRIEKRSSLLLPEETGVLLECGTKVSDYERAQILAWDFAEKTEESADVLKELTLLMKNEGFRAQVVVDYLREAYVYPVSNVRITFDKQIAAGTTENCLIKSRCLSNVLPEGNMVLEVKYDEYLPEHIGRILSSVRPAQTAASKYAMCMNKKLEGVIL